MTAPTWDDLPQPVRDRVTADLAPIGPPAPVDGGFTPGVRVRIPTAGGGAAFIKAIPAHSGAASMYREEASANSVLPTRIGPELLSAWESDGWIVLVFDFVTGRHPDLAPGSPDLQPVLETIATTASPPAHWPPRRRSPPTRPSSPSTTVPGSPGRPSSTATCAPTTS